MKAIDITKITHFTKDETPFGSRDFRDSANNLWRDNLNFNIFDGSGYLTDDAKNHIKANEIEKKDNETWGDAILRHAEWFDLGYQCDKAPKKRSDVKFSGSMILSAYLAAEESGRDYKPSPDNTYSLEDMEGYTDGIDLIELYTEDSYVSEDYIPAKSEDIISDEEWEAREALLLNETSIEMNERHLKTLNTL